jgi:hypothetical protein
MGVSLVKRKGEQGSALLLTIIVLVILLFLGGSLGLLAMVEGRMAQKEEASMQAFYLARSGADAIAQYMMNLPDGYESIPFNQPSSPVPLSGFDDRSFIVEVREETPNLRIVSTGFVGGQQRTLELLLLKQAGAPTFDHAVVALGTANPAVKLVGGAKVEGDLATNAVDENSIYLEGGVNITGGISVGPGGDPDTVISNMNLVTPGEKGLDSLGEEISYPDLVFPSFPEGLKPQPNLKVDWSKKFVLDESGQWDRFEIVSNATLEIDLNEGKNGPVVIRAGHFNFGGHIRLTNVGENGKLIMYVEEISATSGGVTIHPEDRSKSGPEVFTLYYSGEDEFLNHQYEITGNIVSKSADLFFGQGVKLTGSVFVTGSDHSTVRISGGAIAAPTALVYAPNSTVILQEGGMLNGAVVSRSFVASGGTLTKFKAVDEDTFPDGIFDAGFGGTAGRSSYKRGSWSRSSL